ncbi:MAG: hypothetical protein ACRC7N_10265 [Clostridium sp.]
MGKIKIISNPYNREITFQSYKNQTQSWEDIKDKNKNSRLITEEIGKSFLPFKIKEIIHIIIEDYYTGTEEIEIYFEGTEDEYKEVEIVCNNEKVKDKIILKKSSSHQENARDIIEDIKEAFHKVHPVIKKIISDDNKVNKNLNKVSEALKDIIPICVFGFIFNES